MELAKPLLVEPVPDVDVTIRAARGECVVPVVETEKKKKKKKKKKKIIFLRSILA